MVAVSSPFLHAVPPARFRSALLDALVVFGLPYGPQSRERLAHVLPEVFGRSGATLVGYQRWLATNGKFDTLDAFAEFMEPRYQRWLAASTT